MYKYNHHQLLNLPHLRSDNLSALYVAATLRSFACSALGIFIPIYVYKLFDNSTLLLFSKNGALIAVLGYFILVRFFEALFTIPAAKFIVHLKSGFRRSMLFGNILLALKLLFLILAERNIYFLIPSAVLGGVVVPFYWIPYHLIFVEDGKRRKFGRQISALSILSKLASVAGPFLGGLVIAFLGFNFLASVILFLVIISSTSLFFPPHHEKHAMPSTRGILGVLFSKEFKNALFGFVGAGIEGVIQGVIWPLFLFAVVGTYLKVGIISSLVLLVSVLALALIGKWADSRKRKSVLKLGGFSNSLVWGLKIFVQTPPQAFFTDLGAKLARDLLYIPFDVFTYRRASKDPLGFVIVREWVLSGGRLLGLCLILLLVLLGVNWTVAFAVAAVGSLLALKMGSEKAIKKIIPNCTNCSNLPRRTPVSTRRRRGGRVKAGYSK